MLRLRERGALFRARFAQKWALFGARFARLLKVAVLCGTFECTSKWYVKRRHFLGLALLASQKWWFSVALFNALWHLNKPF